MKCISKHKTGDIEKDKIYDYKILNNIEGYKYESRIVVNKVIGEITFQLFYTKREFKKIFNTIESHREEIINQLIK